MASVEELKQLRAKRAASTKTKSGGGLADFQRALREGPPDAPPPLSLDELRQRVQNNPDPIAPPPDRDDFLRAGIATGGAMLGGPLAAATRIPLLIAEPAAAMIGEIAGQAVTKTGSAADVVLAGAFPVALRGALSQPVRRAAKFVGKRLPGAAAGLNELAVDKLRALVSRLRPDDLDSLRTAAKSFDDMLVPLTNLKKTIATIATEQADLVPSLRAARAGPIVKQLDDLIASVEEGAFPLKRVVRNLQEIGARIGELRRATATGTTSSTSSYRMLQRVYKGILDDLDALPASAPEALKKYRTALRNDFGAGNLETIFERGIERRAIDGLVKVNPRIIRNAWRKGRDSTFLRESFLPDDRKIIGDFLDELLLTPPLPRPPGANAGSARVLTRSLGTGGLAGGVATTMLGPEMGGAVGVAAGGIAAAAPRIVARAMMTRPGRNMLKRLLASSGGAGLTPQGLEALAAISRQAIGPFLGDRLEGAASLIQQNVHQSLRRGLSPDVPRP